MIFDINSLIDTKTDDKIGRSVNKGMSNFATVTGVNDTGTVFLRFDGEKEPSKKQYQRLSGYIPKIGDRVLLMRHSGTVLVIDKVVGIPKPFPLPSPDPLTTLEIRLNFAERFEAIPACDEVLQLTAISENLNIRVMTTGGMGNRFTDEFTPIIPSMSADILVFSEEFTVDAQMQLAENF